MDEAGLWLCLKLNVDASVDPQSVRATWGRWFKTIMGIWLAYNPIDHCPAAQLVEGVACVDGVRGPWASLADWSSWRAIVRGLLCFTGKEYHMNRKTIGSKKTFILNPINRDRNRGVIWFTWYGFFHWVWTNVYFLWNMVGSNRILFP